MRVVLAGGSGFLGRALTRALASDGHDVRVLTRSPRASAHVAWQPDGTSGPWAAALAEADVVINLAGEGIADKRWTSARKEALRTSRILPARSIAAALNTLEPRRRLVITSSAVGYYGPRGDEIVTEDSPPGTDFLSRLCVEWEAAASAAVSDTTDVALVRTGIVLHPNGGALGSMLWPFRLGVGGRLGNGRQYWPWIHLDDWVALVAWLATSGAARETAAPRARRAASVWNATAPSPVTNAEFTRVLARVIRRPAVLPAPTFALRVALGEFANFLVTGQRAVPAHAEHAGFIFRFRELDPALRHLLSPRPTMQ